MLHKKDSYRQILSATSLFGVVKVFAIIISLIKSKVVAVLIGPTGMGIISLLSSTINIIGEFCKLGLDTTAVKDISYASNNNNEKRISIVLAAIKKIVWLTGILAVVLTICLSPFLSQIAFNNYNYTLAFIWVSISLLLNQLSIGQLSILQGLRKLKYLAKANLLGNFFGLLLSLPLYYFYRLDAIVPVIILTSIVGLFFSWYFSDKVKIEVTEISNRLALSEGREMIKLGFMLSLRGLITLITAYAFQIYLSHVAGISEVGFYIAGFMIINSYVGLIFNAMRTDYFPRLSAVIDNKEQVNQVVCQQSLVAMLIITPLIVVFLSFASSIIELLYSKEFNVIVGLVSWGILGSLFKTVSWSMGYVILAKGDSNLFIKTALFFNALMFTINVIGYYYGGILGLGISFFIYYIIHFICIKLITFKQYNLKLGKELLFVFVICLLFLVITFSVSYINILIYRLIFASILIVISMAYSFFELNKKVDLIALIKSNLKNKE